jgi:hypothetical protein
MAVSPCRTMADLGGWEKMEADSVVRDAGAVIVG